MSASAPVPKPQLDTTLITLLWGENRKSLYKLRAAMLAAGFSHTTCVHTVNRFCASGLLARRGDINRKQLRRCRDWSRVNDLLKPTDRTGLPWLFRNFAWNLV
jgi:hypothetical protein